MVGGGRRGRFTKVPGAAPERATPSFDPYSIGGGGGHRDSDASLCSSRPSSAGGGRTSALLNDRFSQATALRSINAYLASNSAPVTLKPPLPSARDITETLRFILSRQEWPITDLEVDLPYVLKYLGCPIKLNKSALKAPGTPHAWPPLLSVINWLVQLGRYSDHLTSSPPTDPHAPNDLHLYVTHSYSLFISGDDDAVADLDKEYLLKAEHQASKTADSIDALEREAGDLEGKLRALTSGPSRREALMGERALLMEDVKKFEKVVDSYGAKVAEMQSRLGEREKELGAKEGESQRICEENEELKRRIDAQAVNARDAERMRRELQAVERDIAEAESERNALEEKVWELESAVGRKLKELEALAEQCNHAIRKLKLGSDFQFVLNATGSSPAEVMGITYKTVLKPALSALAEDTKKISVSKLEELISLQQISRENVAMLEEKRRHFAALEAKIEEAEVRLSLLKKEMEDHTSKCAVEAEKTKEEFTIKEQQLDIVEKEAGDFLMVSEQKLQDAARESDEDTQKCARELVALIDAVSEYIEYMETTVSGMKTDLLKTAHVVGEAFKASVLTKLVASGSDSGHGGLKRARYPSPNQKQP